MSLWTRSPNTSAAAVSARIRMTGMSLVTSLVAPVPRRAHAGRTPAGCRPSRYAQLLLLGDSSLAEPKSSLYDVGRRQRCRRLPPPFGDPCMQRRILGVLAALAAALPLASQADTMDYSYAELGYVDTELEATASTWTATASGCAARWRCTRTSSCSPATRTWASTSTSTSRTLEVGVGGHWPLTDKVDLVGRFGIVKAEIEPIGRLRCGRRRLPARRARARQSWRRSSSWKAASTTATGRRRRRYDDRARRPVFLHRERVRRVERVDRRRRHDRWASNVRMTF